MRIGFNRYGLTRCRFAEGCRYPAPTLDPLGAVAWFIFRGCRTSFTRSEWVGGVMAPSQWAGIKQEEARQYAQTHGMDFDGDIQDLLDLCEMWQLKENKRRQDAKNEANKIDEKPEVVN